jgi:hypothetical protein
VGFPEPADSCYHLGTQASPTMRTLWLDSLSEDGGGVEYVCSSEVEGCCVVESDAGELAVAHDSDPT